MALILYKPEPSILKKIKLCNLVSSALAEIGWPTRRVINNKLSQTILKVNTKNFHTYCCLYNYLQGETISWESYSKKHLKLLGQVLGYLHHDLRELDKKQQIIASKECLNLTDKLNEMHNYFMQDSIKNAVEQKLKLVVDPTVIPKFTKLLHKLNSTLPSQLLHLDFVRGNILFKKLPKCQFEQKFCIFDKKDDSHSLCITGVLDFEKVALGPLELDLARTLAFLLVDCKYKQPEKIIKFFLLSGYIKKAKQPPPSLTIIKQLILMYLLIDFYQFLKHNPYESLFANEHFVKTRDMLLAINLRGKPLSGFAERQNLLPYTLGY